MPFESRRFGFMKMESALTISSGESREAIPGSRNGCAATGNSERRDSEIKSGSDPRPEPDATLLYDKILAVRDELAAHKTRRSAFAGIGAETIHHELCERGFRRLPAISTIEKILARAGRTKKIKIRKAPNGPPYPYIPARTMGDLQQTDLVGPRHLPRSPGLTRFYSIHTIDVAGQTVSANQFHDKQTISLVLHLLDSWKVMGLPRVSQMDNEMAASGGGRYRYSLSQILRLHLLFGIHLRFIPPKEPGRNAAVESFNNIWQIRVLRHRCPDLRAVRR